MDRPPPKRPGRPPLDSDDPSVVLSVRVPSQQYDAVYREAQRQRRTVTEFMRRLIAKEVPEDE